MNPYIKEDPWSIIEMGFEPERHEISESLFSLGNGHMGQRANFEEHYSGASLSGSYMAGVYYPDKTRVGWWKNGYPEYFAKVLNSTNWIAIDIFVDAERLDLATCQVQDFVRELSMKAGVLRRTFTATLPSGRAIQVEATRFVSMKYKEIGVIEYNVTPLDADATITIVPSLNGDVMNRDTNHGEQFWDSVACLHDQSRAILTMKTKKLDFYVTSAMQCQLSIDGNTVKTTPTLSNLANQLSNQYVIAAKKGEKVTLHKFVANVTSRDHAIDQLHTVAQAAVLHAQTIGYNQLLGEQEEAWALKWKESDITIEGDISAQQGIRFTIFQLHQTYSGDDERLNIGPKGFTGEKYGGSTYWDTEAYCLPFYLSTAQEHIARNLLIYRYRHLDKARENARKLGFKKGALYPMVTMNGEECHNEWEITFEEIHRNGAIAYAIYNYVNYTGDRDYLSEYGLEVLIEIARFWEERIQYSEDKQKYVMLGVTGPNEYENNVNNNWYTNRIAVWTMDYAREVITNLQESDAQALLRIREKTQLLDEEIKTWQTISEKMYYPYDDKRNVFLQQDGFLDKELIPVNDLDPQELPLNQHWSWDRILRSCYIKQADVLQGLFFLSDRYDVATKKRNFDFYEPLTVHESSLSPCVHSILATEIGYHDKAYEMYLRTARLDLDNYNNDTEDGCHITSMAGTWMSIVYGFGGLRVSADRLCFTPSVPKQWTSLSFKVIFRHARILINMTQDTVTVENETDIPAKLMIGQSAIDLAPYTHQTIAL